LINGGKESAAARFGLTYGIWNIQAEPLGDFPVHEGETGLTQVNSREIAQPGFLSTSEYFQLKYQLPHLNSRKWGNWFLFRFFILQ